MTPYVPQALPLTCLDFARLIRKIGPANASLARHDGLLQSVINPGVMLSPLTNREAVLSSRIEGTQATVDEVLEYEAGMEFEGEKVQDIQEIVNDRKTLTLATKALADRPLNLPLIRPMHALLMGSVRGADRTPGQFDALFDRPIFPSSDFLKRSGISRPTGLEFLRKLRDAGLLHVSQEARGSRSALFAFRELLSMTEGRTVF